MVLGLKHKLIINQFLKLHIMKSHYILSTLLLTFFSFQFSSIAQTKTWVGPSAGSWGVASHWSPPGIPNSTHDVVIPPDTWINIDVTAFMNELSVLEGAIVDKTTDLAMTMSGGNFAFTSTFNFEAGNVNNGNGNGGLFFDGEVNIIGPERKRFAGNVTINNVINIGTGVFDFNLRSNILLIAPGATMNTEDGSIAIEAFTATLRNEGTINKLTGSESFLIDTVFENDDGTMNVDSGAMILSGSTTLNNGEYNINSNGFIELNTLTHFINGTLTGQLDGPFIFNSTFRVTNNAENFLDFSGPAGVEWRQGSLSAQGAAGTILVNKGLLNITGTGSSPIQLSGGVVLRNDSEIFLNEDLTLNICQTCVFNNNDIGVITIEQGVNIVSGSVINTGLIEKDLDTGSASISSLINNDSGILNLKVGNIVIPTSYEGDGIISGDGSINTLASLNFAGIMAPGDNGIGTLDYNNSLEFDSTPDCVYQIEINGPEPDIEHDVFAINANAKLNGTLDVIMGFDGSMDDEFVIITASDIIACNLPSQVTSTFNGNQYTYDVICNSTNVTLKISEVILSIEDNAVTKIKTYPNPTSGTINVAMGQVYSEINVSISNFLGQVISYERFVNTNMLELNIEGSPGIYFVSLLSSEGFSETIKIIKN